MVGPWSRSWRESDDPGRRLQRSRTWDDSQYRVWQRRGSGRRIWRSWGNRGNRCRCYGISGRRQRGPGWLGWSGRCSGSNFRWRPASGWCGECRRNQDGCGSNRLAGFLKCQDKGSRRRGQGTVNGAEVKGHQCWLGIRCVLGRFLGRCGVTCRVA